MVVFESTLQILPVLKETIQCLPWFPAEMFDEMFNQNIFFLSFFFTPCPFGRYQS